MAESKKKLSFEEANARLQEIVETLDKNDLPLEEATSLYEEGVKMAKTCEEILTKCKGRVTILKSELENFLPEED